jgi:hypothetical protein
MTTFRFYSEEQLSPNQARTPEGFLICHAVPIARIGTQLYGPGEVSIDPGPDGVVRIDRDADQVFRPQTIASFEGKPLVINHPDGVDVTPENYRDLAVGHMQNVRRGTGIEDHLLLADFVIMREDAIALILANPNYQVSCGYDAQYEGTAPGRGRQVNIVGNHCAFVEHGRCGPICATKDHETIAADLAPCLKNGAMIRSTASGSESSLRTKTGDHMAKSFGDWMTKLRDAMKSRDEKQVESVLDEGASIMKMTGDPEDNETHTHVHIHTAPPAITKAEGGLPNTGETRVTNAADGMTGGEDGATFGGRTFFSDEAIEERFKKSEDSFEEFKKECRDSFKAMQDSLAEMAKTAGTMVDGEPGETTKEPSGEGKPDKDIEGDLKEEAPPGTGDLITKARDSAMLEDSFSQTAALAEILAPGISVPTFDSATDPVTTYRSICALRRKALTVASATRDGAAIIESIAGRTPEIDTMPCRDLAPLFRGAAKIKAERNNAAASGGASLTQDRGYLGKGYDQPKAGGKRPMSIAEVNRINAQFNSQPGMVKQ